MSEQDFSHALELYRTNLVQYRVTGRPEYKTAYENAESWVRNYLNNVSAQITQKKSYVDSFLQNYSTANPDMDTLKTRFSEIRATGPQAQDDYMTIKRINDAEEIPVDPYPYYVKGGALLALVGAVFVLTTF